MNAGYIFRITLVWGLLIAAGAALSTARAQSTPEVEVDTSVLESLGSAGTARTNAAPTLRPPLARPSVDSSYRPSLIGPETSQIPSAGTVSTPPPMPPLARREVPVVPVMPPSPVMSPPAFVSQGNPVPSPVRTQAQTNTAAASPIAEPIPVPLHKPDGRRNQVVRFPVQTKIKTESINPSLPVSAPPAAPSAEIAESLAAPTPKEKTMAVATTSKTFDTPLPGRKPETIKKAAATGKESTKIAMDVPLPKKRPASDIAAQGSVKRAGKEMQAQNSARRAPREIKPGSEFSMPAVPAEEVTAQELESPLMPLPPPDAVAGDDLESQIASADADKEKLTSMIETISEQTAKKMDRDESAPADQIVTTRAEPLRKREAKNAKKPKGDDEAIDITADPIVEEIPARKSAQPENDLTEVANLEMPKVAPNSVADNRAQKETPRPPPPEKYEEEYITLPFAPGVSDIDQKTTEALQGQILPLLKTNTEWRLQIQSFASPTDKGVSSARRTSLARALAIRTWLMDQGIEARRMDVRALGTETDRTPPDRVDLVFFDPQQL